MNKRTGNRGSSERRFPVLRSSRCCRFPPNVYRFVVTSMAPLGCPEPHLVCASDALK